jgi:hypothetical protein
MLYAQHFTRENFDIIPSLKEKVCVIFETDIPFDDEHINEFKDVIWKELWKQYPLWNCPYHQGRRPPTLLLNWRHGFSSASQEGPTIRL